MRKQGVDIKDYIIDGEKSLDTYKFKDDLNEHQLRYKEQRS